MPIYLRIASIARVGLALATANTLLWAIVPAHVRIWDKAEHLLAFYVLSVLAAVSFPRTKLLLVGVTLSAFGAGIEFVQMLPFVHRDPDIWDWVADTLAILIGLAPMAAQQFRFHFIETDPTR